MRSGADWGGLSSVCLSVTIMIGESTFLSRGLHSFRPGGAPFRRFQTRGSFDELVHRWSFHPIFRDFICAGFRRRLPSTWAPVRMDHFTSKTGPGRGVPLGGSLGIQGNRCHPRGMRNLKPRLLSLEWGGAATPRAMNFLREERGWLGRSVLCLSVCLSVCL